MPATQVPRIAGVDETRHEQRVAVIDQPHLRVLGGEPLRRSDLDNTSVGDQHRTGPVVTRDVRPVMERIAIETQRLPRMQARIGHGALRLKGASPGPRESEVNRARPLFLCPDMP